MATSADGVVWSKRPDNPILPHSAGGWDNSDTLGPMVLKEDGVYKMWYTGGNGGMNAIGYATSSDGVALDEKQRACAGALARFLG